MRTYIYIWGNPQRATLIGQAENWEEASKRFTEALAKMGIDTTNGTAIIHELRTPIQFV